MWPLYIVPVVLIGILCVGIWHAIPQATRCRWGFHEWMAINYPWWGGCEQGTYCCDHRMKVITVHRKGSGTSYKKRVPFTAKDVADRAHRVTTSREHRLIREFNEQLERDMRSDDACEELLP